MIISGVIPDSENGISIYGNNTDNTPFYPCLDENLSPIIGFLLYLYFKAMFTSFVPSPAEYITT